MSAPISPRDSLGPNDVEPYSPTRPQIDDPIEFPVLGASPLPAPAYEPAHQAFEPVPHLARDKPRGRGERPERAQPDLTGTQVCRNVYALANGQWHFCGRDKCSFAHSQDELRGAPCSYGENCRRGERCQFWHPTETVYSYYQRIGRDYPGWLPVTNEQTRRPGTDRREPRKFQPAVPPARPRPDPIEVPAAAPAKATVLLRIKRADLAATMELLAAHNLDRPVTIEYLD